MNSFSPPSLTPRLVESLYTEAMILADEARSYFEREKDHGRAELTPHERVAISCESLRVTTRLMHCIAWLLNQRACFRGELQPGDLLSRGRRLGKANGSDSLTVMAMNGEGRHLVHASEDLYERIARLEVAFLGESDDALGQIGREPPVRQWHRQLSEAMTR